MDHLQFIVFGRTSESCAEFLMGVEDSLCSFETDSLVHWAVESNSGNIWAVRLSSELVHSCRLSKHNPIESYETKIFWLNGRPKNTVR